MTDRFKFRVWQRKLDNAIKNEQYELAKEIQVQIKT